MSQILAPHRASILAVVFTVLLAACGQSQPAASAPQTLSVAAKEFAFAPVALTVKVGQPVTIDLQNQGAVEHDWSVHEIEISGEAKSSDDAASGHMMGGTGDEPKLHVAAGIGGKGTLTFTPSKPGTYEYYCTVAGHKEAGMVGTLTVSAS
jgi:uncharacterized cupredoxin-like copper-binding protein